MKKVPNYSSEDARQRMLKLIKLVPDETVKSIAKILSSRNKDELLQIYKKYSGIKN